MHLHNACVDLRNLLLDALPSLRYLRQGIRFMLVKVSLCRCLHFRGKLLTTARAGCLSVVGTCIDFVPLLAKLICLLRQLFLARFKACNLRGRRLNVPLKALYFMLRPSLRLVQITKLHICPVCILSRLVLCVKDDLPTLRF